MAEQAAGSFGAGERARKITHEPQFIDAPEHPLVIEFFDYIERKRGTREMPDRADISPAELTRFLPNMIIAEAMNGGEDFRTRLFGTALVELLGEERTGKLLSEFAEENTIPTNPEEVQTRWLHVTRKAFFGRKPIFLRVPFAASNRLYLVGHAISVPITAGGTEPAQTIGAMFVSRAETQPD
ncbi:PAS domain-containing protein [Parvibaculum sp.]|uniref:PAS domain-containing protein n=1 Tax=Parvibaculum sp. TaxID=2024848 RepID=UPI001DC5777E|nr:PAS domain-containing protein [Parvibaculum sp.]MBX3489420.1 PAS domain-containing protein [Parvibaculum sp.]MCW5726624.1 PAS domain-containing protein [Parvibaculum sp.]